MVLSILIAILLAIGYCRNSKISVREKAISPLPLTLISQSKPLEVLVSSLPSSLHPLMSYPTFRELVFTSAVELEGGLVKWKLLTHCNWIVIGQTMDCALSRTAIWGDGKLVKALDFIRSFEIHESELWNSFQFGFQRTWLKSVVAQPGNLIRVEFSQPGAFQKWLFLLKFEVFPAEIFDHPPPHEGRSWESYWRGFGLYQVMSYKPDRYVQLVLKAPNILGVREKMATPLIFTAKPSLATRLEAVRSRPGLVVPLSQSERSSLADEDFSPAKLIATGRSRRVMNLFLNHHHKAFSRLQTRLDLFDLLPLDSWAPKLFPKVGAPPSGLFPESHSWHCPLMGQREPFSAASKRLMRSIQDWPLPERRLQILALATADVRILDLIARVWEPLGLEIEIKTIQSAEFSQRINAGHHAAYLFEGEPLSELSSPRLFFDFSRAGDVKGSRFENVKLMTSIAERMDREDNWQKRHQLGQQLCQILTREMAFMPLFEFTNEYYLISSDVQWAGEFIGKFPRFFRLYL